MKTTMKDVILICKGWYNKEKYHTTLDALKAYYNQNYRMDDIPCDDKRWIHIITNIVLYQAMHELALMYPDRLPGFINLYLCKDLIGVHDEFNYTRTMYMKITDFFHMLTMRGDCCVEIDTSDYFTNVDGEKVLKEPIVK